MPICAEFLRYFYSVLFFFRFKNHSFFLLYILKTPAASATAKQLIFLYTWQCCYIPKPLSDLAFLPFPFPTRVSIGMVILTGLENKFHPLFIKGNTFFK